VIILILCLSDGQSVVFTQSGGILTIGWLMNVRYEPHETQDAAPVPYGTYAIDAKYSPDGQWIIFESLLNSGNYNIALMRVDGTGRIDLTIDPSADFDPSWRPTVP